jgi:hypothetical protein
VKAVLLALVLACSQAARAELPADAPKAIAVHKGEPVAADGVCLSTEAAAKLYQACQAAELENKEYVKALEAPRGWTPGTAVLIGGGVAAVVLGFVVGYFAFHR